MTRIDDINGLKAALRPLFQRDDLEFSNMGSHGVMFTIASNTR